jgi:hypothetical protein
MADSVAPVVVNRALWEQLRAAMWFSDRHIGCAYGQRTEWSEKRALGTVKSLIGLRQTIHTFGETAQEVPESLPHRLRHLTGPDKVVAMLGS